MTKVTPILLMLLFSSITSAKGLLTISEEIRSNKVTLTTLVALTELERIDRSIGYGLCTTGGNIPSSCDKNGTLGYGLCAASGNIPSSCDKNATLGYGLCAASGNIPSSCK